MEKNTFSNEELKNIGVLLQRVDLKGNEALAVAQLQIKINNLLKPETVEEPKPETPTSE